MDSILRAAGMYVALVLLFRVAGRRSLADLTTFDFVLLLIIGKPPSRHCWVRIFVHQRHAGDRYADRSRCGPIAGETLLKPLARLLDGHATLVVENGRFLHQRMRRVRLTEDDILESARDSQGIEHIEQVKFAIVERNGKISFIRVD